jgi:hypothetical protein
MLGRNSQYEHDCEFDFAQTFWRQIPDLVHQLPAVQSPDLVAQGHGIAFLPGLSRRDQNCIREAGPLGLRG